MGTRKQMTIGITINLDNYENIRFDVTGEVESDKDASELIAFLDGVLSKIGRDDEATTERVDHYRNRVFGSLRRDGLPPDELSVNVASCPFTGYDEYYEELIDRDLSGVDTPDPQISAPECPPLEELEEVEVTERATPVPNMTDRAEPDLPAQDSSSSSRDATPPAEVPPKSASPFICEACGAEVNKVQHDVSHLFMNKTLCKQCMNRS